MPSRAISRRTTDEIGYRKDGYMRVNLKVLRVKMNLNQAEMAEKCGIGRVAYSAIERGDRGGSMEFWKRLQNAFSVPDEKMFSLMRDEERN